MSSEVIIVHGALGSRNQLGFLTDWLTSMKLNSSVLEFSGHGSTKRETSFGVQQFANELEAELKRFDKPPIVFGYSMGGYVALYLAALKPSLFAGLVTLATKFDWSPEIASKEVKMLNPSTIQDKVPAFAEVLKIRHENVGWKTVCEDTSRMMMDLGSKPLVTENTLQSILVPVILAVGDEDKMVTIDETRWAHNHCANASLTILPLTKHPIERLSQPSFDFLITSVRSKIASTKQV